VAWGVSGFGTLDLTGRQASSPKPQAWGGWEHAVEVLDIPSDGRFATWLWGYGRSLCDLAMRPSGYGRHVGRLAMGQTAERLFGALFGILSGIEFISVPLCGPL
jgi:hypothetical protein